MRYSELAKVYRSERLESVHHGIIYAASMQKCLLELGDADFCCYTRSIIKPIQAKVALEIIEDCDYQLKDQFIAAACASHLAEDEQMQIIYEFQKETRIKTDEILCGISYNCSGKHLAILLAAHLAAKKYQNKSWLELPYNSPQHPYNKKLFAEIKKLSQVEPEIGVDGCSLPTFYMSIRAMAKLFLSSLDECFYSQKIYPAMQKYPFLIGGKEQIDSRLMAVAGTELIVKAGAEGLMLLMNLRKSEVAIIKIVDGAKRAKATITAALAEKLGYLKNIEEKSFKANVLNENVAFISSSF